jgi:SAM-dependent methyltransferase
MVAWDSRIEREKELLLRLLDRAPDRSVVDVGCGTGEHTAFFARAGARAVGIDRSPSMIEKAKDHEGRGEGRFVLADAAEAQRVLGGEPPFGLAVCLGNMLPHVKEAGELDAFLEAVRGLLAPGGLFLIQIVNYRRILDGGVRHLPLNFREGEGSEEIVFLRLLRPLSEERLLFFPTTLVLDSGSDEPVSVRSTRRVELRPWTLRDLGPRLERLGFEVEIHGDMQGGPFRSLESPDLVLAAART